MSTAATAASVKKFNLSHGRHGKFSAATGFTMSRMAEFKGINSGKYRDYMAAGCARNARRHVGCVYRMPRHSATPRTTTDLGARGFLRQASAPLEAALREMILAVKPLLLDALSGLE